jgi:hypothetical protein
MLLGGISSPSFPSHDFDIINLFSLDGPTNWSIDRSIDWLLLLSERGTSRSYRTNCVLFSKHYFLTDDVCFVHAVSPWTNRNSGKLQISEHIQLYGLCSGICSLQEFSIQIGCIPCIKSYYFPLAIDRALSFQNVNLVHKPSHVGLDPVNNPPSRDHCVPLAVNIWHPQ